VIDGGSGSGILRRKIPLLVKEKTLNTVCFDSFISEQALKRTRSVFQRVIFAG
jgi:hypothetical protein